jgi:acetyltransferase-like isoleucine patch superfamily enzyme
MSLPGKVKKLFFRSPDLSRYIELGPGVDGAKIQLEIRKPIVGRKYLFIGEGSVIDSRFVFERDRGEIIVGKNTFIGGSTIICAEKIEIGNDVLISWGCTIIDNDAHALEWEQRKNDVADWRKGLAVNSPGIYKDWSHVESAAIKIGDKVWIGFNSVILKGLTIGEGAVIGAGSVVTKDVPEYSVVAGNPARVIKELKK